MGKKLKKYRVAIVAEFESDLDLNYLGDNIYISLDNKEKSLDFKFTTFEVEQLDYPKVNLEEIL